MGRLTRRMSTARYAADGSSATREDALAVEEPLEIRVNGASLSVTMRSPGDDFDLVAGFLVCLLYTSPSPRDRTRTRMPSSA